MKIFLLIPFLFSIVQLFGQNIQANKVNVFTLKIDYDVPAFEGGNLAYFDCSACTNDSLPFEINYQAPSDFGSIEFKLIESQSTFFLASIIWMGNGIIVEPQSFSMENPFVVQQIHFAFPNDVRIFDEQGVVSSDIQLMQAAQTAWTSIEDLVIVRDAMENDFKVGMYLYTPTVGMTDYSVAKWIVFLYKNVLVGSVNELNSSLQIYPNPVSREIKFNMNFESIISYQIVGLEGRKLQADKVQNSSIMVENLSSGTYFLELFDASSKKKTIRFEKY